jgi:hypothetical protein
MSLYLDYFFTDGGQIVTLVTTLAVWAALTSIGGLVGGQERLREGDTLYGWAAVCLVFTALGVIFVTPFEALAWMFFIAAPIAGVILYRREGRLFSPGVVKVLLLAAPLLLLTSAKGVSEWDEFSHWVPTARFLAETHGFPWAETSSTGGAFPAYPYHWPLLGYLANRLAGGYVENAGGVLNALLLLTFGLVVIRLVLLGAGREENQNRGWSLCAAAVLASTIFNPTFAQKVALTAYADASSAVAVGLGAVLGWFMLKAQAQGDQIRARSLAWQFGLVMLVLVNIKQANPVLVVMLVGGIGLAGLRDPGIRFRDLVRMLPRMVVPPLLIFGLWRYHVVTEIPGTEATLRPFADWNIHILGQIFLQMLMVASKKGVYFAIMALAVGFGVKGLIRFRGDFDRLAIIVGGAFLGYNAFLYFIFVAQFGEYDALRVASYWRYNMHLGLMSVAFGAYGLAVLWKRTLSGRPVQRAVVWLPIIVVLVAPLAFAKKVRFDLEGLKPLYQMVGANLAEVVPKGSKILILDLRGTGESGVMTKYRLGARRDELRGYLAAFHDGSANAIRQAVYSPDELTHILVHSQTAAVRDVLAVDLPTGASHLLERTGDDGWRIVRSWPHK